MKKLSTVAALAVASLVAANVFATDHKGVSGMRGMEGKEEVRVFARMGRASPAAPFMNFETRRQRK